MAGISFQLKNLIGRKSISSKVLAFGYSMALSSGNWLISIIFIFTFSKIALALGGNKKVVYDFNVYITNVVALGLISSGLFQFEYTRFASDRIFEKKHEAILPNYLGAFFISAIIGFIFGALLGYYFFWHYNKVLFLMFALSVSVTSCVFLSSSLLTGLKDFKYILISFLFSYFLAGVFILIFKKDIILLVYSFYISQNILLILLMYKIFKAYYSDIFIKFDFLKKPNKRILIFTGFMYYLGAWIDKYLFWFSEDTAHKVIGNMGSSLFYDIPITLAYISLLPGISALFLYTEAEFFEYYDMYYSAVREFGTLEDLYYFANMLISSIRDLTLSVIRIQIIFDIIIIATQNEVFVKLLKIPKIYLLEIDIMVIAATVQLLFITLFSLCSYFDLMKNLLKMSLVFFITNFIFTYISIKMGPYYYGYGLLFASTVSSLYGIYLLRRFLDEINYYTFVHSGKL